MCPTDLLGITWPDLAARVEAADLLWRWAEHEPALAGLDTLRELGWLVHGEDRPAEADAVLGALLRLASRPGIPAGADAALVVAHLVKHGSTNLAWNLRDLSRDIDTVVAATLWVQIRTDRWGENRRGYAKALLWETRKAVLAEMLGRGWWQPDVVLLDARVFDGRRPDRDPLSGTAGHPADAEQELCEVLAWAQASGIVTAEEIAALIEIELVSVEQRRKIAARKGRQERSLRRQRRRILRRLQAARLDYLDQVA